MEPIVFTLHKEANKFDDERINFIKFSGFFSPERLDCFEINAGFIGKNGSNYSRPIFLDIFKVIEFRDKIDKILSIKKSGNSDNKKIEFFVRGKDDFGKIDSIDSPYFRLDFDSNDFYTKGNYIRVSNNYLSRFFRCNHIPFQKVEKLYQFLTEFIDKYDINNRSFYVFSYGSNLLLKRIKKRVPSAEIFDIVEIIFHKLVFNKKSIDNSAKANFSIHRGSFDINSSIWGVIHEIKYSEKPLLDKVEGLNKGYDLIEVTDKIYPKFKTRGYSIWENIHGMPQSFLDSNNKNEKYKIFSYTCQNQDFYTNELPYDWYLTLIIQGAIENGFPEEYIEMLRRIETKKDLDANRRKLNLDQII